MRTNNPNDSAKWMVSIECSVCGCSESAALNESPEQAAKRLCWTEINQTTAMGEETSFMCPSCSKKAQKA